MLNISDSIQYHSLKEACFHSRGGCVLNMHPTVEVNLLCQQSVYAHMILTNIPPKSCATSSAFTLLLPSLQRCWTDLLVWLFAAGVFSSGVLLWSQCSEAMPVFGRTRVSIVLWGNYYYTLVHLTVDSLSVFIAHRWPGVLGWLTSWTTLSNHKPKCYWCRVVYICCTEVVAH